MTEEIFVLDRKVRLLQPEGGFRTSLDSVMLAAACPAGAGERVLDLGCGVGGAMFCLLQRGPGAHVTGLEIQAPYLALARENAVLNKREGSSAFIAGDVAAFRFATPGERVDHVMLNPPFLDAGTYTPSPDQGRAAALGHEGQESGLEDWVDCAFHALKNGGTMTLIHRADYVDKIVQALGKKFGQTEIFPLWPRTGEAAKRVVVRSLKDRRSPAILHSGLVLHEADGAYTAGAERVLRDGERLF